MALNKNISSHVESIREMYEPRRAECARLPSPQHPHQCSIGLRPRAPARCYASQWCAVKLFVFFHKYALQTLVATSASLITETESRLAPSFEVMSLALCSKHHICFFFTSDSFADTSMPSLHLLSQRQSLDTHRHYKLPVSP